MLIEYVVNGLQASLLLFIVSAGLTLSFGLMRVTNLAHGSFYMLGAFGGITAVNYSQSFTAGIICAALFSALAGLVVERFLFRRLYERGAFAQVLVSFGLIFVFDELVRIIWGGDVRSLARPLALQASYPLLGARIESYRLFLIVLGGGLSLALFWMIKGTSIGAAIRAAADDRESAELLGLDVKKLFSRVFATSAGIAGLAGFIAAPLVTAFPGMGDEVLIAALIVVVLGGVGSLLGSLLGSLIIGCALTAGQVWMAGYANSVMYVLLALVLVFRPLGLLGRPE
jgi:branched-chain amino acid transport system permease protein